MDGRRQAGDEISGEVVQGFVDRVDVTGNATNPDGIRASIYGRRSTQS